MMRNLSVRNATYFHQRMFLLIGLYGMMVIIKNSETLYTPMGTAYTSLDIYHDPKYRFEQGLIKFSRASNKDLVETEPMYLHKVYSKYTIYDYNQGKSVLVPYNNILVHKIFEKDLLYIGLGEKYTYWNVFLDEDRNSQFLYYHSTVGNTSDKFENIHYEPDYKKERTPIYNDINFQIKKIPKKMW